MSDRTTLHGVYFALSAYLFWGIVPIYFKWIDHVSPLEILAHRIVWALVLLLAILACTGDLHRLRTSVRQLPMLLLTASLLSANWLLFIYAVVNENIAETSLGYFINPLVTIFLGVVFLRESMRPLQWLAVVIAATGIALQLLIFGAVPWLALGLAFSFGCYGLIRKNLGLHAIAGLALETAIVTPFALAFLFWGYESGFLDFGASRVTDGLLMLGGFVTSFPLLCFAAAVTRLSLVAIGFFQYIAPSLSLILAVFYYGEAFDTGRAVSFGFIWVALAIFSSESVYHQRKKRQFSVS